MLTKQQIDHLRSLGVPEQRLTDMQAELVKQAQLAVQTSIAKAVDSVQTPEADAEPPPPTTPAAPEVVTADTSAESPLNQKQRKEVATAIEDAFEIVAELVTRIEELEAVVMSIGASDEQKMRHYATQSPAASIQELMGMSPIGNPAAAIDGRSSLAKSGPAAPNTVSGPTEMSFVNRIISESEALASDNAGRFG